MDIKNCILTLNIYTSKGNTETVQISIPQGESENLDTIVEELFKQHKADFDKIQKAVNIGVNNSQDAISWTKEDIKDGKAIANYSISSIQRLLKGQNARYDVDQYIEKLNKLGYKDIDTTNILLVDSSYEACGFYENGLVVISPKGFRSYLEFLCVRENLMHKSEDTTIEQNRLKQREAIVDILYKLPEISEKFVSLQRDSKIMDLIDDVKGKNKDQITDANILKFLNIYYLDYFSKRLLAKTGIVDDFKELAKDDGTLYIDPFDTDIQSADVKAFIKLFMKDGKMPETLTLKLSELTEEKFPLFKEFENNIQALVQYINREMKGNHFFDIDYVAGDNVIFKTTGILPSIENEAINTYYFGKVVEVVKSIGNTHIIKINDKYYISDYIPAGISDAKQMKQLQLKLDSQELKRDFRNGTDSYPTALYRLQQYLKSKTMSSISPALSFEQVTTTVTEEPETKELETEEQETEQTNTEETDGKNIKKDGKKTKKVLQIKASKMPDIFRFVGRGLVLEKLPRIISDSLRSLKSYDKLRTILLNPNMTDSATKAIWGFIYNGSDYNKVSKQLSEVLKTDEDLIIFFQVYNKFSQKFKQKDGKQINIQYRIIEESVKFLKNNPLKVYEAKRLKDDTYSVQVVKAPIDKATSDPIPLFQTKYKNLRVEMMNLAEVITERFGIPVICITTEDIKKYKGIYEKSKAFIYNNRIYINVDKANTESLMHEFGHLILQKIKVTPSSSELYYKFMDLIEELRNAEDTEANAAFKREVQKFESSSRARMDVNEELFVYLFGEIVTGHYRKMINQSMKDVDDSDIIALTSAYKTAIGSLFQVSDTSAIDSTSITSLLNITLGQLKDLGAQSLSDKKAVQDLKIKGKLKNANLTNLKTREMSDIRKISNLIEELIKEDVNGNQLLIEECI